MYYRSDSPENKRRSRADARIVHRDCGPTITGPSLRYTCEICLVLFAAPCDVVQRPIRNYPDVYGGSIIYVDFPFQCSGLVTGVQFFAENRLDFYLSAWRPSASGDSWTLIWYTIIVPQRMRAQVGMRG